MLNAVEDLQNSVVAVDVRHIILHHTFILVCKTVANQVLTSPVTIFTSKDLQYLLVYLQNMLDTRKQQMYLVVAYPSLGVRFDELGLVVLKSTYEGIIYLNYHENRSQHLHVVLFSFHDFTKDQVALGLACQNRVSFQQISTAAGAVQNTFVRILVH